MAGIDGHPYAGAGDAERRELEDLAALVAELELFVRLVAVADLGHEVARERQHVERDRRRERVGWRELDRMPRVGELGRASADVLHLVRQLGDALEPRTRHRLIGADDDPPQAGGVAQRRERGHPHHRRAVGVGDDPLADVPSSACGLTSLTTSGTSGSMRHAEELSTTTAPAATTRGASRRDAVAPAENNARSRPSTVGGGRVLDLDLGAAPRTGADRPNATTRTDGAVRPGTRARRAPNA